MRNRVFFPQACLDQWGVEGKIELSGTELVLLSEGRRYAIDEVVRVLVEVTGGEDPHGLVGKVRSKAELEKIGAEILEDSMILGENAYDIVPGWSGVSATTFAEHLASDERASARQSRSDPTDPTSEEDLLQRFAGGTS